MIEAMIPGPVPGSEYQPSARPMKPASNAPATPSSIVMMKPPGSFPGINSFAIAPTTKPMIKVQRKSHIPSEVGLRYTKRGAGHL